MAHGPRPRRRHAAPEAGELKTVSAVAAPARDYPFRRFFARQFDNSVAFCGIAFCGALAGACLWWGGDRLHLSLGKHSLVLWIPALLGWAILEASLLTLGWSTPGKWLFGLRVRPLEGAKASFWSALNRSTTVLTFGQGGCLPVVGWYAGIQSYRDLTERGATSWDRGSYAVEGRPFGALRILLAAGVFLALLMAVLLADLALVSG